MTACHIHRVRSDASVALQAALRTSTTGIYLTHDHTAEAQQGWRLRLECGYALGDQQMPTLAAAHHVAGELADFGIDWSADYLSLRRQIDNNPAAAAAIRSLLANSPTTRTLHTQIGGAA